MVELRNFSSLALFRSLSLSAFDFLIFLLIFLPEITLLCGSSLSLPLLVFQNLDKRMGESSFFPCLCFFDLCFLCLCFSFEDLLCCLLFFLFLLSSDELEELLLELVEESLRLLPSSCSCFLCCDPLSGSFNFRCFSPWSESDVELDSEPDVDVPEVLSFLWDLLRL